LQYGHSGVQKIPEPNAGDPVMLKQALYAAAVMLDTSAAHAEQLAFPPNPSGQVEFVMPSGNIGCIFTPEGGTPVYKPADGGPELSCDRVEPDYRRFVLGRSGPATEYGDVQDASCCSAINAFAYGYSWAMGGFSCASTPSGLTCIRGANGFFISRSRTSVW
jgi:hypothetical protein